MFYNGNKMPNNWWNGIWFVWLSDTEENIVLGA